ncbi:MAG: aminotransferase class III-fold pyridoxal phosphate-dependent enzyme [Chitinophagales bacterium]
MLHNPTNPSFTLQKAESLAWEHFRVGVTSIKELPSYEDQNFHLKTKEGKQFTLKIKTLGTDVEKIELEHLVMLQLNNTAHDLQFPQPVPNQLGELITQITTSDGSVYFIRLLTWVAGRMLAKVNPHTPELLENLGEACGRICWEMQGLDHLEAHRTFKWNNSQAIWIKDKIEIFEDPDKRSDIAYFIKLYETEALPHLQYLPKSIVHNDLNDFNVLVTEDLLHPKIAGVIDFGDVIYTNTINELAICIAYNCMNKKDPLTAACHILKGCHRVFHFLDAELKVLFPLIAIRLAVSIISSTEQILENPENEEYLLTHQRPAWILLKQWKKISPSFAYYAFREVCGFNPCPKNELFVEWVSKHRHNFGQLIFPNNSKSFPSKTTTYSKSLVFDLSVGSLQLGNNPNFEDAQLFDRRVQQLLVEANANVGIGRYNEIRPIYTTDSYLVEGDNGPQWRSVHMGLDIFMDAETPIFAPLDGTIHSFQNNDADRDYGPTIILEHRVSEDLTFYTLYGHLSLDSLEGLQEGQKVWKGQQICKIGPIPINGNWPPHLHFQVILDMLGKKGDFEGVVFPHHRTIYKSLCPDPNLLSGIEVENLEVKDFSNEEILQQRQKHLGRSLSVSYHKPLQIQRAFGPYLYEHTGRRYLDTANNVPHIGHQHPRIVKVAQEQMAVLNTNTRYLHPTITAFAEKLCATLPPELSVCHFVNSGSEANELAVRMAKAFSGQRDMVVMEVGYHGNTNVCVDISSYKFEGKGGSGKRDWVHVVEMPGKRWMEQRKERKLWQSWMPKKSVQSETLPTVEAVVKKLKEEGKGIAGFICESILSCGGQIVLPPNYLKAAYEQVRAAGGVCIADEVQVGFGRVGDYFWGFELQGVVPDIVTMGKPIGNGHPLAAVVTTPEIAAAFANGMEYFNTFGGNPVSCAIGLEVLKVIEDDGLQANALKVGNYLKAGLQELMKRHSIIGDVRGHGLFLGFELVKNRETFEPAPEQTTYLANRMRELGILLGTDGLYHNVIKIKPPMVFSIENADFLLATLNRVLQEDFMRLI